LEPGILTGDEMEAGSILDIPPNPGESGDLAPPMICCHRFAGGEVVLPLAPLGPARDDGAR
jgi:hypothetical protein